MRNETFEEIISSNNIKCVPIDEPRTSKLAYKLIRKEVGKKIKDRFTDLDFWKIWIFFYLSLIISLNFRWYYSVAYIGGVILLFTFFDLYWFCSHIKYLTFKVKVKHVKCYTCPVSLIQVLSDNWNFSYSNIWLADETILKAKDKIQILVFEDTGCVSLTPVLFFCQKSVGYKDFVCLTNNNNIS